MLHRNIDKLDYSKPIEIAEGIFWVGFSDENSGLHCNPYLIIDGDEAIVIDGGSRNDFSSVMMKILQTGINPNQIKRLIYHHYDPDLCGSIPHFESIINNDELKIISHYENNIFIKYYSSSSPRLCIESLNLEYEFSSGRKLKFIRTPYSHSPGSFVTYDAKTKTLFSSDIFGSYNNNWELYLDIREKCLSCLDYHDICNHFKRQCQIKGIVKFHQRIMTSMKALNYAFEKIENLDINIVAPQHGSIIGDNEAMKKIIRKIRSLKDIGIDWYLEGNLNE